MGTERRSLRLAWLEGIRIFAAVLLLIYHAQLLFTDYAFTPQATGIIPNWQKLMEASAQLDPNPFTTLVNLPAWFGFQFVDVFVLVSGFSLVLSLKDRPLVPGDFLKKRLLRILVPFWTVAWLAYPALWAIGTLTHSYIPDAWHTFAGITFPLLFDYGGELLLPTNGPWWFVPLILSFALIFPVLWHLVHRWGARNLLLLSLILTLGYRALAVYLLGGHPTYVILNTAADWQPFLSFASKLSTFVVGMMVAQAYRQGKGPVFWHWHRALGVGVPLYGVGFICQFYQLGWVVADLLLPLGLTLICMVVFRAIAYLPRLESMLVWLGAHSYSYFLIHNFVVDRTLNLVVKHDPVRYHRLLPVMVLGTLALAVVADTVSPQLQRIVTTGLVRLDAWLTSAKPSAGWKPRVGDRVCYRDQPGWLVLKVERLRDEAELYICQISNGYKTVWLNQRDLFPEQRGHQPGWISRKR